MSTPAAAVTPPAAADPSAPARPAGAFYPLTEKCAFATKVAFDAGDKAETALYAAEYALDELARLMKQVEAARAQLTTATKALRNYQRDLDKMAAAYIDRAINRGTVPK